MKAIRLLACILFVFAIFEAQSETMSEHWVWLENSKDNTFSIKLKKAEQGYTGTYCAVGMAGSRIDCSPKHAIEFSTTLDGKAFSFTTNYSRAEGTAKLTLQGDTLVWQIVSSPRGEHYAPRSATLKPYEAADNTHKTDNVQKP